MIEYAEEWASIENGWADLLNKYGAEGWELVQAVLDEIDQDGKKHAGRHRLIFMRVWEDDDGEDGEDDSEE